MPTYYVHHTGYVSHVEEVEADTPEAALEASEGALVSLCHQCSREWDAGGDPEITAVSDETGETVWEAEPARSGASGSALLGLSSVQFEALSKVLSIVATDPETPDNYGPDGLNIVRALEEIRTQLTNIDPRGGRT